MTSEVAIANASAIALAADSAVTIGNQKIYNSALKLFALSKVAPVGVMVYGNAGLLDVPWETIIKTFRKKLGKRTFEKLSDYANEFILYLQESSEIFPEEAQAHWVEGNVDSYYRMIRDEFFAKIHPIFKEKGKLEAAAAQGILSSIVNEHHSALSNELFADEMSKDVFSQVREQYLPLFKEVRERIFEEVRVSSAVALKLYDVAAHLHVKQIFSSGVSGIVIAGYGESEIYPSIITFDIEGVVVNRLKYRKNKEKSHTIERGLECRIVAFAQDDMVTAFMNGVSPHVLAFIESYLVQLFDRLPELMDENTSDTKKKFKVRSSRLLKNFFEKMGDHLKEQHSHPVLRMVTVLPKDELAAMAEALVNLTAFKRRMTEDMETVGGPIDVAVISKGDGLVWVKRKHYFPPDLNRPFFDNYFRGL